MVKMTAQVIQDKRSERREKKAVLKEHGLGMDVLVNHYEAELLNQAMHRIIKKDYRVEGVLGTAAVTETLLPKTQRTQDAHLTIRFHTEPDQQYQERVHLDRVGLFIEKGDREGSRVQIDFVQGKIRMVSLLHSARHSQIPFASFQEHSVHYGLTDFYVYADKIFSRTQGYPYIWISLIIDPHSPQIIFTTAKQLTQEAPHGGAGNITHTFSYKAASETFVSPRSSEKFSLEDYTDALQTILGMVPTTLN